ncbi:MAG: methylglyoxal synthase [Synergistota bacterium]|nr:methylglyoxal synthase [Synergistota bacterium]
MEAVKKIALVAHDSRKKDLIRWAKRHREQLAAHRLCSTGTTGALLEAALGLPIDKLKSGPLGGDQQLGARIACERLDAIVFLWDPLNTQAHDSDIKALLRIATLYNIPMACNMASADFLFSSPLISLPYDNEHRDFDAHQQARNEAVIEEYLKEEER